MIAVFSFFSLKNREFEFLKCESPSSVSDEYGKYFEMYLLSHDRPAKARLAQPCPAHDRPARTTYGYPSFAFPAHGFT